MKRVISIIAIIILSFLLISCGTEQKTEPAEEKGCEIAMIAESTNIADSSFTQTTWKSVKAFADENNIVAKFYQPEKAAKEGYMSSIEQAADDGAEFIVLPGSVFETAAYQAQSEYPDIDFLLIDGVPHNKKNVYATASNTVSIIFAEEEAGYMAGYAVVSDGYTKLGFMGGQAIPAVKRYGYGFVQGAAAAAADKEIKVEINYKYTGEFKESEKVESLASKWYKDGTEVIFAAGGSMSKSVIKAYEKQSGKVIGVDMDQSDLSEIVITSAMKGINSAVRTVLKSYADETFIGGTAFNYTAKNDGVMLEMKNSRFRQFNQDDYKKIFNQLKNGKIKLKKDTGVKAVSELTGEWVTIKE